jgi:hypothetical protein
VLGIKQESWGLSRDCCTTVRHSSPCPQRELPSLDPPDPGSPAAAPAAAPAPAPAAAPAAAPAPAPQPQPVYAPQPQPQPQPAYAPPPPQPAYAPQPQPQPQPVYAPQPQPGYAPQPQPGYAPQPAAAQPGQFGAAGGAAVGVGGAAAAATPAVRLGQGTHLAFTADRLFVFHYWAASGTATALNGQPPPPGFGQEVSVSGTQIAFLGGGASTGYDEMQVNPYAVPRLGFDAVLNGGFSVGGSIVFLATSGSMTTKQISPAATLETTSDISSISALGFSPRAGFLIMFNETVGIWPRLGFSYISSSTKTKINQNSTNPAVNPPIELESKRSFISIDPEALLVITPVPHFGFTFGLQAAIGVSGSASNQDWNSVAAGVQTIESDVKFTNIGLTAGLLGYL